MTSSSENSAGVEQQILTINEDPTTSEEKRDEDIEKLSSLYEVEIEKNRSALAHSQSINDDLVTTDDMLNLLLSRLG